jgi:hypothetical protein
LVMIVIPFVFEATPRRFMMVLVYGEAFIDAVIDVTLLKLGH